jgi:hypothetical protein
LSIFLRLVFNPLPQWNSSVVSHFDEDHIKGLAETIKECGTATVYSSAAMSDREFFAYALDPTFADQGRGHADTREIVNASLHLDSIGSTFYPVVPMTQLKHIPARKSGHGSDVRVFALSPSETEIRNSLIAFAKCAMRPGDRLRKQVPPKNRNQLSVVVWVDCEKTRVCLGADLEVDDSPKLGWRAILARQSELDGRAEVFKVPHHGSWNAFSHAVWDDLLVKNPIALLAPWSKGGKRLPTTGDVDRIGRKTNSAHITTIAATDVDASTFPADVGRLVKATARKMRRKPAPGAVRVRYDLAAPSPEARIEYIAGSAGPL